MSLSSPAHLICIAHRGASGYEPENTLRSFLRALELGATWIECDVRAIEDHLIVFHDRTLNRMAGKGGLVEKQTFEYLRSLDVGKGEKIPLLSEVLSLIKGKAKLHIELKGRGVGDRTARFLKTYLNDGWAPDSFIVSSFDHDEILAFSALAPTIPLGLLLYGYPLNTLEVAASIKAFAVHLHLEVVTPKRVGTLQERGFKVFVYTVNEPSDISAMRAIGVDGIFTDFPDRALTPGSL